MIFEGIVYLFQENHVYSQPKRAKYRITLVIAGSLLSGVAIHKMWIASTITWSCNDVNIPLAKLAYAQGFEENASTIEPQRTLESYYHPQIFC